MPDIKAHPHKETRRTIEALHIKKEREREKERGPPLLYLTCAGATSRPIHIKKEREREKETNMVVETDKNERHRYPT